MSTPRKVWFNHQKNSVRGTLSRGEYTAEEKEAVWMTSQELTQIKTNIRDIVLLMNQGNTKAHPQSNRYCTRGLESLTPHGNFQKKRIKYFARRAVLNEQHYQYALRHCIYNPQRLATYYQETTNKSRIAARVNGILDAEFVAVNSRTSTKFPRTPMKVEMARPEIVVACPENEGPLKRSRLSFISRAA
jgi:hypothetical protein